jgi:hypothetical protein
MKIFTGTVSHKHGTDTYMGSTEDALYAKLYEFVRREWGGVFSDTPIPEDHQEAVHYYFNNNQLNVMQGSEDSLNDIGPTDIKAKLHCIVLQSRSSHPTIKAFVGQTREEACQRAIEYLLDGDAALIGITAEKAFAFWADTTDDNGDTYKIVVDEEVEV